MYIPIIYIHTCMLSHTYSNNQILWSLRQLHQAIVPVTLQSWPLLHPRVVALGWGAGPEGTRDLAIVKLSLGDSP